MTDDDPAEDVEICEIVITAPDTEWLATFCRSLIEDRLVAAVHIIEDIRTLYRWQGEIHDTHEARAHLRTRRALADTIRNRVGREHPYEVPSVITVLVASASAEYSHWIQRQTRD